MSAPASGPSVLVVAGESSGDKYGAALVEACARVLPGARFFGIGGPRLAAAGAEILFPLEDLAVVGLVEVLSRIPRVRRVLGRLGREAEARRPDAAVLIDSPDFNLRLAPRLRAAGIPVLYYVSPTVWAWRRGRLRTIRRSVDKMLLIFPFEEAIYREAGIPHAYVGHPLLASVAAASPREAVLARHGLGPGRPVVALLPGSRGGEVAFHMAVLSKAAERIRAQAGAQFLVVRADTIERSLLERLLPPDRAGIEIVEGGAYDAMAAADLVVSACGTANLETAWLGTPLVAFYRLSPLTYLIGRPFVRIRHYSIVNILAGRPVVPELIQDRFTPEAVAAESLRLLRSPEARAAMKREFAGIRSMMDAPDASGKAARELSALIQNR